LKIEYKIKNNTVIGKDKIKGLKALVEKFASKNTLKIKVNIAGA
tara:strand:- start:806 stop:937 length:132 start_codon:yes stop_codon:yes gene_type:complete